ncbi:hypothetical protein HDU89_007230 [Geranomyces variabilis]|nr:hypothetical protein HDU89_007230 [Geranomyces variabilis]
MSCNGSTILLVLMTILVPPAGVFAVAGCGMDLFINILLTILGYIPGHIHAFYIEWKYLERKEGRATGNVPYVYSERVHSGSPAYWQQQPHPQRPTV